MKNKCANKFIFRTAAVNRVVQLDQPLVFLPLGGVSVEGGGVMRSEELLQMPVGHVQPVALEVIGLHVAALHIVHVARTVSAKYPVSAADSTKAAIAAHTIQAAF